MKTAEVLIMPHVTLYIYPNPNDEEKLFMREMFCWNFVKFQHDYYNIQPNGNFKWKDNLILNLLTQMTLTASKRVGFVLYFKSFLMYTYSRCIKSRS